MDASLVDIMGGIGTLLILAFFLKKVWHPKDAPPRNVACAAWPRDWTPLRSTSGDGVTLPRPAALRE